MSNLSTNFTLEEMIFSETAIRLGIDNTPSDEELRELTRLCVDLLQPLRDVLDTPVIVSSGFRNEAVNRAVNGSDNSDHMDGRAGDIKAVGLSPVQVCRVIEMNMDLWPIKQAIHEFAGWTHLSIADLSNGEPRRELLTATKYEGKTRYVNGIMSMDAARELLDA